MIFQDGSKYVEIQKKVLFPIDYVSIVKKTSQEEIVIVKMSMCNTLWSVNLENASMYVHWTIATQPHSTPFLHNVSTIYHRTLHFYMGRIPPW